MYRITINNCLRIVQFFVSCVERLSDFLLTKRPGKIFYLNFNLFLTKRVRLRAGGFSLVHNTV